MNDCEHVYVRVYPPSVSTVDAFHRFCHSTLALQCVRRAGVLPPLREDCAQDFLLHIFTRHSRAEAPSAPEHDPILSSHVWLRRSAHNCAIDFLRHQSFISRHKTALPEETESSPFVSPHPTPEAQLLAKECRQRIQEAVACLTPAQQDLFTRLIVNGDSAGEVAEATGRTAHTIRQARSNLCKQLRQIFARRGITEEDLREYISLTQNWGGGKFWLIVLFQATQKFVLLPAKITLTFARSESLNI